MSFALNLSILNYFQKFYFWFNSQWNSHLNIKYLPDLYSIFKLSGFFGFENTSANRNNCSDINKYFIFRIRIFRLSFEWMFFSILNNFRLVMINAISMRQQLQEENQGDISQSVSAIRKDPTLEEYRPGTAGMSQSVSAIRQDPGGIQTRYSSTFRSSNQADPLLEGEEEMLTTLTYFVSVAVDITTSI